MAIKKCNCVHAYQDIKYGKDKRVFNPSGGKGIVKWRCTVCGKEEQTETKKK